MPRTTSTPSDRLRMSDDIQWDIQVESTRANREWIQRTRRSCKKHNLQRVARLFVLHATWKGAERATTSGRWMRKISRNAAKRILSQTKDNILTRKPYYSFEFPVIARVVSGLYPSYFALLISCELAIYSVLTSLKAQSDRNGNTERWNVNCMAQLNGSRKRLFV